jgi:hypothetical protein
VQPLLASGLPAQPPRGVSAQEEDEVLAPSEPGLSTLPLDKDTFRKLVDDCGFPRSFLRALMQGKSHFSKTYHEDEDSATSLLLQTGK